MKKIKSGIYKITNTVNKKFYIGSTYNFAKRKRDHFNALLNNTHSNAHFQASFNKHGEEAFIYEVLETVKDISHLTSVEQTYLDYYGRNFKNKMFNICFIAGSSLGVKRSKETRKKLSVLNTGKKHSKETCKKISDSHKGEKNHFYGKKHSEESLKQMREVKKGKKLSEEHKRKIGKSHKEPILVERENIETGEVVCYDSIAEAARSGFFYKGAIAKCCKGKQPRHAGYYWRYQKEIDSSGEKIKKLRVSYKNKPVVGTNIETGEEIYFISAAEAHRNSPFHLSCISDCCLGKRKRHRGYTWRFANPPDLPKVSDDIEDLTDSPEVHQND